MSASAELREKLSLQRAKSESRLSVVQGEQTPSHYEGVGRARPASAAATFRSGWTQAPLVEPPLAFLPRASDAIAPGSHVGRKDLGAPPPLARSREVICRVNHCSSQVSLRSGGRNLSRPPRHGAVRKGDGHRCGKNAPPDVFLRYEGPRTERDATGIEESSEGSASSSLSTACASDSATIQTNGAAAEVEFESLASECETFSAEGKTDALLPRNGGGHGVGHVSDIATLRESFEFLLCAPCSNSPDSLGSLLNEYIERLRQRLTHWLESLEPSSSEVADTVSWFFFEVRPALSRFAASNRLSDYTVGVDDRSARSVIVDDDRLMPERVAAWQLCANALQRTLIGEWENRACYERVEEISSGSEPQFRILRFIIERWQEWKDYPEACECVASVLVAVLNAMLRSGQSACQKVVSSGAQSACKAQGTPKRGKRWRKRKFQAGWRTFAKRIVEGTLCGSSVDSVADCATEVSAEIVELTKVAAQAINVVEFCGNVDLPSCLNSSIQMALADFKIAFGRLASVAFLSMGARYVDESLLKESRDFRPGRLSFVCAAAERSLPPIFLGGQDSFATDDAHAFDIFGRRVKNAIAHSLADRWLRLVLAPLVPHLGLATFCLSAAQRRALARDETALSAFNSWCDGSGSDELVDLMRVLYATFAQGRKAANSEVGAAALARLWAMREKSPVQRRRRLVTCL